MLLNLKVCFIAFLIAVSFSLDAKNEVDSLTQIINGNASDSLKATAADKLAWKFMFSNPDTTIIIANQQLVFAKSSGITKLIINAFNNLATANAVRGNLDEAEGIFLMAEDKAKELDSPVELSIVYNNLGLVYSMKSLPDTAINYYQKSLNQYDRQGELKKGKGDTYNNIGIILMNKGDYDDAIKNYLEALKIYQDLDVVNTAVANTYNNIGIIYMDKGNYPKSLDFHIKSMKVFEQINVESANYAFVLNNIGIIYGKQKDFKNALSFYHRAEKSFKKINENSLDVARVYNNIGDIYIKKRVLDTAEFYFKQSLKIQNNLADKSSPIIVAYSNLGQIEELKKEYSSALTYYQKALKISEEIDEKKEIAEALLDIGRIQVFQENVNEGIANCLKSFNLSEQLGLSESKMNSCECLSEAYEKIGNINLAFRYYKLFQNEKDSLLNQNNTKAITEKIMQYSFDKQQYQDSLSRAAESRRLALIQKEKDIKKEAEIQKQRAYSIATGIGFILMLGLAFVLYKGYQNKQKANKIILKQKHAVEEQKEIIEEKNREIVDSISYAKRIQDAILPSQKIISTILPEVFVFFNPKDIVSGDFYWVDKKEDYSFFAAVDCTGHGVPGALVSVVGHNGLNRVLNEFQINEPAKMLDKLNEIVEETFSKNTSSIKDGMDLALCRLNTKTFELDYAGANNPLYIIRDSTQTEIRDFKNHKILTNDENGKTLIEIKPNKQPIGSYEYREPFANYKFQLLKGDMIYVFSDGFADQFGGEKGKKFMYKPFKRMLTEVSIYPIKDQRAKIESIFSQWKSGVEQIDDVCILGVKIA